MTESSSTTTVELGLSNAAELSSLDLKNPFVTVQVDSNRINQTFGTILEALQNVRVVVSNLHTTVEGTKSNISAVRTDLADFKKAWEEDPRIADLNEKSASHGDRITVLEEQLSILKQRMDKSEQRMAKQESKTVDFTPLEDKIKALQKDCKDLTSSQSGLKSAQEDQAGQLGKLGQTIAAAEIKHNELDELVQGVYKIFEMSQGEVLGLVRDPNSSKPLPGDGKSKARSSISSGDSAAVPTTALTQYVLGLPSFRAMYADFNTSIGNLSARLNEELMAQKKKLAEESVHLRSKLGEKLDERRFVPVMKDLEALAKKVSTEIEPRMDKLVDELDTKASLATVQKMHDHLDQVKADKGDLVGLLHRDDLIPLERDIQQLAEAIDRSGAKLKLDIEKNRQQNTTVTSTPDLSNLRRSSTDDKAIHAKLVSLEGGINTIQEDYVRKGDLGDVYMYVDNNLAKIQTQIKNIPAQAAATPTEYIAPSTTPGLTDSTAGQGLSRPTSGKKRSLAPLMRPVSAGQTRAATPPNMNNASIPETIRSPSPPINYTSSPANYVPNPAKYRGTASLFDCDGNRTVATVTAANVPIVDHWHNVARAAAGEETVPSGHKTHTMS